MDGLGWVDIALLAVLGLSVIVGLVRGLTFEVLSLAGWVAAFFAAHWLTPELLPMIPIGSPESALRHGAVFVAAFVLALIVWSLAARLLSLLIKASPLNLIDRLLGAVFGVLRGAVLLLVLATVVSFTPWERSASWQASVGAVWLNAVVHSLAPLLPPELARHLPA